MFRITLFLIAISLLAAMPLRSQMQPEAQRVSLQFPNNPVVDIATFYGVLTGKQLILDANLAGPNLAIVAPEAVSREEAIRMIEAALILNGYTLVPVDAGSSKLLGPTKQPRSESVPLYSGPEALPKGDQIVSYFMPFTHISSEDAVAIFNSYVSLRPYGSMVPVPNANALVITENVPLIRRLIELQPMIDVQIEKTSTQFFTLQRADAQKIADMLGDLLTGQKPSGRPAGSKPAENAAAGAAPVANGIQVVPDIRTNRVLVVGPERQMPYIGKLIADLDVQVAFEEPYERPLRFVKAGEVFPVLVNMLTESLAAEAESSQDASSQSSAIAQDVRQTSQSATGNFGSASDYRNSYGGTGGSKPDRLQDPMESTAPLSMVVGNARLIADRSVNKIIVIGPPESRTKAARVLDLLDRRPKQVYLATIIGQLTLGDGVDFGIDYLAQFGNVKILGQGNAPNLNALVANRAAADLVPDPSQVVSGAVDAAATAATSSLTNAATQLLPVLSGLTVFGTIAESVDVYARALASSNKFEVISRPVIYTANNKRAVISSGQRVPIPESTLTSAIASTTVSPGASIASNIEYKDVVLKLEVIPLINSNNEVTLTIAQQNDNIQQQVEISGNQVPVIGTQELTTTVTVPNRHTIVLGGLITDEEQRSQTGIPFLKDIPGLGYLFSSTNKNVVRRELIILIQPFIIDGDDQLAEANMVERANTNFQSGMYEDKIPVRKALLPDTPRAEERRKAAREARE